MSEQNPLVSIIMVSWNGAERLKKCLPSLKKQKYPSMELIFVDNGSKDNSLEILHEYFPNAIVVKNETNLGYAYPNNQGLERASGEYIYLLNNDTQVDPDFVINMVEEFEDNKDIDIAQSKILLSDKPDQLDSAGAYLTKSGFLVYEGFEGKADEYQENREIFFAKGAACMFRKEVSDKVGLFDGRYFAYWEEADFCWRAHLAGYKTWFIPSSIVYHDLGQTNKKLNSDFIDFHSFKNRLASLIKNLNSNDLYIVFIHVVLMKLVALTFLLRLKPKNAWAVFKAIWWNLLNLGETLKKRKQVQNWRKLSDQEIFEKFGKSFSFSYFFWLFWTYVFKWR